jgi:hypothetical protein
VNKSIEAFSTPDMDAMIGHPWPGDFVIWRDPQGESVTEGCLVGSDPNFTLTNSAGATYKLNIPPSAIRRSWRRTSKNQ